MRNLTPLGLKIPSLAQAGSSSRASNLAIDPESGAVYVAVERAAEDDGGVEVDIIRLEGLEKQGGEPEVSFVNLVGDKMVALTPLQIIGSFSSPVVAPFPKPDHLGETVDLHFMPDDKSLVILLAGGDIATLTLEGPDGGPAPVSRTSVHWSHHNNY